jgi:hypothetical protein
MPHRRFRFRIAWITAALAATGLCIWWTQQPVARVELASGGTLTLRRTTFGSAHEFYVPPSNRDALWEQVRQYFRKPLRVTTHGESLMLHLEFPEDRKSPAGLIAPYLVETPIPGQNPITYEIVLRHQEHLPAREWDHTSGREFFAETLLQYGHHVYLTLPVFDRRRESIELQFSGTTKQECVHLPNPLFGRNWPEWKAEPLPLRKKLGEYTVTFSGWKPFKTGVQPIIHVERKGVNMVADAVVEYSDATGNRSRYTILPKNEPAWKMELRLRVSPHPFYALTPEEQASSSFSRESALTMPARIQYPGDCPMERLEPHEFLRTEIYVTPPPTLDAASRVMPR